MKTYSHSGNIKLIFLIIGIFLSSISWSQTSYLDTTFTFVSKGYVNSNGNSIFEMLGGTEGGLEYSYPLNWGLSSELPLSMIIHDSMRIPEYSGVYLSLAVENEGHVFYTTKDDQWIDSLLPEALDSVSLRHTFALIYTHNPAWDIEWDKTNSIDEIIYIKSSPSKMWLKLQIDTIYTSYIDESWRVVESIDSIRIKIATDSAGNGKFKLKDTPVLTPQTVRPTQQLLLQKRRLILPLEIGSAAVTVTTIQGRKILFRDNVEGSLSLSMLPAGVYVVQVRGMQLQYNEKLILK